MISEIILFLLFMIKLPGSVFLNVQLKYVIEDIKEYNKTSGNKGSRVWLTNFMHLKKLKFDWCEFAHINF